MVDDSWCLVSEKVRINSAVIARRSRVILVNIRLGAEAISLHKVIEIHDYHVLQLFTTVAPNATSGNNPRNQAVLDSGPVFLLLFCRSKKVNA